MNATQKEQLISLVENDEIYYEDAAQQLNIERGRFIVLYNSIRSKFSYICNYTHCIRRLDDKAEEFKHQICHDRKAIDKELLEIALNYLESKDNTLEFIANLQEKYNKSSDDSYLAYLIIDLDLDFSSDDLEQLILSLFSSDAYFGQSNTILRKNEEFITGLISKIVNNDDFLFKNEKLIQMKKPCLIVIQSNLNEFLSYAFELAGINCGMRNLINHQKETMKKVVIDLTDEEQQKLRAFIPTLIVDKIINKTDLHPINLEFLSNMIKYMCSPFVDSLKSIIPNYEHAKQKVGLPFRRLLSSIELNLKENPFVDCPNCKTTILKDHKFCHNCGRSAKD